MTKEKETGFAVNSFTVGGHIKGRPKYTTSEKGIVHTSFRIEARRPDKKNSKVWVPVIAFGDLADYCAQLNENDMVVVEGYFAHNPKSPGNPARVVSRVSLMTVGERIRMRKKAKKSRERQEKEKKVVSIDEVDDIDIDDIPF